jgi:DNA-binding transcriptional LysR family regulator
VRWLDELVSEPQMSFKSNSILAQCNAAVSGLGIVLLPTFVAAGVKELQRIAPEINVQREVWVSVRTEQAHFARIESVTQFLEYIFKRDADFLLGKTEALESL